MYICTYLTTEFGEGRALEREALIVRHVPMEDVELTVGHGILQVYSSVC